MSADIFALVAIGAKNGEAAPLEQAWGPVGESDEP